jgi:carbamoyl-phosphate synthase large subunit
MEAKLEAVGAAITQPENTALLTDAKRLGFLDRTIADLTGTTERDLRTHRKALGLVPTYKMVDTCAAEFEAQTPYFYSCYDSETEGMEIASVK